MTTTASIMQVPSPVERDAFNRFALRLAAAAAAGAAAGTHADDSTLKYLFAATAVVQLGWAAVATVWPGRAVAGAGAGVNAVAVGAWLASRVSGLPIIDSLREPESAGTQDVTAAGLGAMAVAFAVACLVPGSGRRKVPAGLSAVLSSALLLLAVPGMVADHSHGHDESPVVSLDDPRVTEAQRAAAQDLIDATAAGLAAVTDIASAEAAGYRLPLEIATSGGSESAADAVRMIAENGGGMMHLGNPAYLRDGKELDPQAIETVMFEVSAGGEARVVSAMYMLEQGRTMDDVPDIAGELTTWHAEHDLAELENAIPPQALEQQKREAEEARASGRLPQSGLLPPMLHVWVVDNVCGPFGGLESLDVSSVDECGHGHGDDHGGAGGHG